jgi:hypothetical protein
MSPAPIEIPEDITPQTFYEEVVPRAFRQGREQAKEMVPMLQEIRASLRAEVQGDGGGVWTLTLCDGELDVRPEALPDPLVTLVQSREDWQVSVTQGLGVLLTRLSGAVAPATPSAPGMPRPGLTPQKIDRLKLLRGVMNFDLAGLAGERTVRLKIILNGAVEGKDPTSVLTMTAADYRDVAEGRVLPQQAFLQGKLRITGDAAFALQLLTTALMPQ